MNGQLASAKAQQAKEEAALQTARQQMARGSTGDDVGATLGSGVIQNLRSRRAEVSLRVANLEGRYGAQHPEMLKAQRELVDIDQQIRQETGRILSNLEAQAAAARTQSQSLASSVAGARGRLGVNERANVRLQELETTAQTTRAEYERLLKTSEQTTGQEGIQRSDARILSRAQIPTAPTSPNRSLNLMIGLMLAAVSAAAAVLIAELLERGLSTTEEVERELKLPLIASIPLLSSTLGLRGGAKKLPPEQYVVEKQLSAFSEAFRKLATSLLFFKVDQPVRTLAITSALPGEGKTTTSLCLARTMALSGRRVVLVECDLRRRSMHRMLKRPVETGLLEVLNGSASLDDALVQDEPSGATLLPVSASQFTPKDVFGSAAMDTLLGELQRRFEVVLLDTAPVLAVADTRVLAAKADAVLFLTRWNRTPRKAASAGIRELLSVGAEVVGVALTQVDMRKLARYGYGEEGYYMSAYRNYYAQ